MYLKTPCQETLLKCSKGLKLHRIQLESLMLLKTFARLVVNISKFQTVYDLSRVCFGTSTSPQTV